MTSGIPRLLDAVLAIAWSVLVPLPAHSETAPESAAADTLIVVVGADPSTDYGRGALLGIEEGRRSAELLGSPLEFRTIDAPVAAGSAGFARSAADAGAVALVAALPDSAQTALERAAATHGLVVLDARPAHPDAATERPTVFRVGVPESARNTPDGAARPVLWDAGLFRYGAEQLNERYRRRFDAPMNEGAWAAWMAVKAVTEATLRARREGGPEDILSNTRTAFDGHKGAPLAFRGPGRALAQPLYVVEAGQTRETQWPEEDS